MAKYDAYDTTWQQTDEERLARPETAECPPPTDVIEMLRGFSDGDAIEMVVYSSLEAGVAAGASFETIADALAGGLLQLGFRRA